MKKTCEGCKALDLESCSLNYKIQKVHQSTYGITLKPLEDCPKPRTIKEFIKLSSLKH